MNKIVIFFVLFFCAILKNGWTAETRVYDNKMNLRYRVEGNKIYDNRLRQVGHIDQGRIYDQRGRLRYRLETNPPPGRQSHELERSLQVDRPQ